LGHLSYSAVADSPKKTIFCLFTVEPTRLLRS
jgi:hypothetical protein